MYFKYLCIGCLLFGVLTLALSGCGAGTATPAGLPNPASVYCAEQGYTVEIRRNADGSEYGVCVFDEENECEEWAFFRGECDAPQAEGELAVGLANPASVYCEEQGYTVEMRTDAEGGQYGMCVFDAENECEEWAFFRGECSAP